VPLGAVSLGDLAVLDQAGAGGGPIMQFCFFLNHFNLALCGGYAA
jgi:hypothetical protein